MWAKIFIILFFIQGLTIAAHGSDNDEVFKLYKSKEAPSAYFDIDEASDALEVVNEYYDADLFTENVKLRMIELRKGVIAERDLIKLLAQDFFHYDQLNRRQKDHVYKYISLIFKIARSKRIIDDVEYRILSDLARHELITFSSKQFVQYPFKSHYGQFRKEKKLSPPAPVMGLIDYYSRLKRFGRSPEDKDFGNDLIMPLSDFGTKLVKGEEDYTPREKIYLKYNPIQVKAMGEVLSYTMKIMAGLKTSIVVENDGEKNLVIDVSLEDQYRLALREYLHKKKEFERNGAKIGMPCDDIDILIAGLELKIISKEEVSMLINNPDFYRPKTPAWEKVLKYAGNLALLGLQLNPTTAPYMVVPMIVFRSYQNFKAISEKKEVDNYLFTLPEVKNED